MDGNTEAASAAELRSIVEQWFRGAGSMVSTLRAIRNISLQRFPYSLAGFVTEDSQEPNWEQLHQELLNRRKVTADTLQQEGHYLQLLLEPLQQIRKNDELWSLFQLAYADIGEDFATGKYSGGRFAWAVVQNAAYDILHWSQDIRVLYQFEDALPDSPAAELESLDYRKVPAGEEPAPGYYEQRGHAYQFQKLQEECPLSEEDFNNITARLFTEHSQMLRILEQRQQHETQQQLLLALSQVKTQTTEAPTVEVHPADSKTAPKSKSKADPEQLVAKLRRKIEGGYLYPNPGGYEKLGSDIGGAKGTWTKIFNDPKNADLVDWRDNRSVCARNSLAVEQAGYEDEEWLPEEELEKVFIEQVKTLPKKEQGQAWEQFRKMATDQQRRFIIGIRS
jgi:hypothetical protein